MEEKGQPIKDDVVEEQVQQPIEDVIEEQVQQHISEEKEFFIDKIKKSGRIIAEKSTIIHKGSGKRLRYGDLVEKAIKLPLPENVKVRDHSFKIIGNRLQRLDTAIKTEGSAVFATDVSIPGMVQPL